MRPDGEAGRPSSPSPVFSGMETREESCSFARRLLPCLCPLSLCYSLSPSHYHTSLAPLPFSPHPPISTPPPFPNLLPSCLAFLQPTPSKSRGDKGNQGFLSLLNDFSTKYVAEIESKTRRLR